MEQIDVHILDREYRLAVDPDDRDRLLEASRLVDERMRNIRDAGKVKGADRIAVMAALQIANDLLGAGANGGAAPAAKAAARIKRISEDLEAELLRQESLF
jgi:cell division protein ZapA